MQIVDRKIPIWVGRSVPCSQCKSVIRFEFGDDVTMYNLNDDSPSVHFICPVCEQVSSSTLLSQ